MAETSRRQFLWSCTAAGATALSLRGEQRRRFLIESNANASFHRRLAERELLRGLALLQIPGELAFAQTGTHARTGEILFQFRLEAARFKNPEAYSISSQAGNVQFSASTEPGLLYAVFDFLEHQGVYFGVDGEIYPPESPADLLLPGEGRPWEASPRFATRGLLPWPDFLNCITVYNDEDFRAYFEAMLRMRFNTFGMHVYSSPESTFSGAESYLSFDFAGAGHQAFLDNSSSQRWGFLPERTSSYGMGAPKFFSDEVFGSDATTTGRNPWEIAERTKDLLRRSFSYARRLGIATGIGFEPYQVPDATLRALPPDIKPNANRRYPGGALFDVESVTAKCMLEDRLGELLEAYPDVDHVWLWEDENMNWESRKTGVPLSLTPFQQAYSFLKRHAPEKRMVLAGWGGVVRHFEYFHERLPKDITFACLNDSLGWDPVSEIFGKLEGRERWPIPWMEDDPSMWLPQFHVNRTQGDVDTAEKLGCQGILGIHWRNRIMDATAGYLARSAWDRGLTPASHFASYARSQATGDRAVRLGRILNETDLHQNLLHTGTNEVKDGHIVTREWAADYDEGFLFWRDYQPEKHTVEAQRQVAADLKRIADEARLPLECERTGYLAGYLGFAVPYTDAWTTAHHLNGVLDAAGKLKAAGHADEAKQKVMSEGVPLWTKLAPLVRETMLRYQAILANREDLGQLASMQDKYVRLALYRLPLSMQEYLGDVPPGMQELFHQAIEPDPTAPARVFLPTRPTMLGRGERFHIYVVAAGNEAVDAVTLHTRPRGASTWTATPASLKGRRTYETMVGPFDPRESLVEYYVSARIGGHQHVAPLSAPQLGYAVTLI